MTSLVSYAVDDGPVDDRLVNFDEEMRADFVDRSASRLSPRQDTVERPPYVDRWLAQLGSQPPPPAQQPLAPRSFSPSLSDHTDPENVRPPSVQQPATVRRSARGSVTSRAPHSHASQLSRRTYRSDHNSLVVPAQAFDLAHRLADGLLSVTAQQREDSVARERLLRQEMEKEAQKQIELFQRLATEQKRVVLKQQMEAEKQKRESEIQIRNVRSELIVAQQRSAALQKELASRPQPLPVVSDVNVAVVNTNTRSSTGSVPTNISAQSAGLSQNNSTVNQPMSVFTNVSMAFCDVRPEINSLPVQPISLQPKRVHATQACHDHTVLLPITKILWIITCRMCLCQMALILCWLLLSHSWCQW